MGLPPCFAASLRDSEPRICAATSRIFQASRPGTVKVPALLFETRVQSPKRQRPMELSAPRLHVSNTRHDVKEIKQCILPRSISANFNLIIYDFSATMDYK